jgi:hypothetical protein
VHHRQVKNAVHSSAPTVVGAFVIRVVMTTLSFLTDFIERSPIHSDSWGPLLSVWAGGAGVGVVLVVLRTWVWATAWLIATAGALLGFVSAVFLFLVEHGT